MLAFFCFLYKQRNITNWKISNRKIGRLITFEPTVVLLDGKFVNKNLKEIRYSIDNILQMLREKEVFDISEIETAIVEPNYTTAFINLAKHCFVAIDDGPTYHLYVIEFTRIFTVFNFFGQNSAVLWVQTSEY